MRQNLSLLAISKTIFSLFACLTLGEGYSQTFRFNGPTGSGNFGNSITVLTNGNYVVTDPLFDKAGFADVGAVYLYNGSTHSLISTITGSQASDRVGSEGVVALTNGNFVIISTHWRKGSYNEVGAVTWGNGVTGISGVVTVANSLVGSTPNDNVGSGFVTALPNGHYVVVSPHWENTALLMNDAGAVTWGNGNTGISGAIAETNSLVGSKWDDAVGGNGIIVLSNGNYVVSSSKWGGSGPMVSLGAVTWCNKDGGTVGRVSASNSLVGTADGDDVGSAGSVVALPGGNYVVATAHHRHAGLANAGAVTWGNGLSGISGNITPSNSLVGSNIDDKVGSNGSAEGIVVLSNGNYVVCSSLWDNGGTANTGAVTWANGATGKVGLISSANSLVGTTAEDRIGGGNVYPLKNGHYVISSPNWNNGAIVDVGAVTWGNGVTGLTGTLTTGFSIVGSHANDRISDGGITALTNGNYVISSPYWDNGGAADVGAVTLATGSAPTSGVITSTNSLFGVSTGDFIGQRVVSLTNDNYVISNPYWNQGGLTDVGSVTLRNGSTALSGSISPANSLIGTSANDHVGWNIVPLTNGNYVVGSRNWNNGTAVDAGAVTWASGITGITGVVSPANSLVGSNTNDLVGKQNITGIDNGVRALANGNYIVESHFWKNAGNANAGAVTLGDGMHGIVGTVSALNSLVGSTADDQLGYPFSTRLEDSYYLIRGTNWDMGATINSGSMTLGNGSSPLTGTVTLCNSVLGGIANQGGSLKPAFNPYKHYLIVGLPSENAFKIFDPTGSEMTINSFEGSLEIIGNNPIPMVSPDGCQIMATITPISSTPIRGKVNYNLWVEGSVPSTPSYPFVARHFQVTPEDNTQKARLTLYFTNKDFLEFNNHPNSTLNLPENASDVAGVSNLRVEKFAGISDDGTGLPASYHNGSVIINPDDSDIIWNGVYKRWEVSFDVTSGFSGFIVHTNTSPLPVRLVSFTGKTSEHSAQIQWEIENAKDFAHFELERSKDGKEFDYVAKKPFELENNRYQHIDLDAFQYRNNQNSIYYRLKMIDLDGSYAYSRIISLKFDGDHEKFAYPNPFSKELTIRLIGQNNEQVDIQFLDSKGMVIDNRKGTLLNNKVHLSDIQLPIGTYIIRAKSKTTANSLKVVKQE